MSFYARLHKLQKVTVGFVMSVCPDVRIKKSIPIERIFMKYYLRILRITPSRIIKFGYKFGT